jgi:hypothetical protein
VGVQSFAGYLDIAREYSLIIISLIDRLYIGEALTFKVNLGSSF